MLDMDKREVLNELGLSDGEARVYLALLKLGSTTVSELTKQTGQHRTTLYDFLEHLMQKGLVSYVIKTGVKYFKAGDPDNLFQYLKEKQDKLGQILPELKQLADEKKEALSVEVYHGIEGFKTMWHDRLRAGGDLYGFGVDESLFKDRFPHIMNHFINEEEKAGFKELLLTKNSAKFVYPQKHLTYRYIPDEFFEPTATGVYGERVFIIIFEPLTTILIKNKSLAESYRRHHQMLWAMAKKKPTIKH